MSIFKATGPARIRIETDTPLAVDAIVPCFIAAFPAENDQNQIRFAVQVQNPQQLAELIAGLIRYGILSGVMQEALASLASAPTHVADIQAFPPKRPGHTPPDDVPPHLRNRGG